MHGREIEGGSFSQVIVYICFTSVEIWGGLCPAAEILKPSCMGWLHTHPAKKLRRGWTWFTLLQPQSCFFPTKSVCKRGSCASGILQLLFVPWQGEQ